jgi:predicted nucleotidyltransferase
MPVRSLNSSVLRWPERAYVLQRLGHWAAQARKRHPQVTRLGYFGSYAREDAGVGSDLDLIVIVSESDVPFERRSIEWDLSTLPIPADILIYTEQEWRERVAGGGRFARTIEKEVVWIQYPE